MLRGARYQPVKRLVDLLLILLVLPAALVIALLCALAVAVQSPGASCKAGSPLLS